MDLLIGTYTEGTDALGIYGVVVSSEPSSQAIALDIPVRNPSFLAVHPSLPILYVVEELGKGEGGGLVSAFSWNGVGFSRLSSQSSLGEDPCHLSISLEVNSLRLPTTHQGVWWYSSWMTMAGSMMSQ